MYTLKVFKIDGIKLYFKMMSAVLLKEQKYSQNKLFILLTIRLMHVLI